MALALFLKGSVAVGIAVSAFVGAQLVPVHGGRGRDDVGEGGVGAGMARVEEGQEKSDRMKSFNL
jgi:hypothetical protein